MNVRTVKKGVPGAGAALAVLAAVVGVWACSRHEAADQKAASAPAPSDQSIVAVPVAPQGPVTVRSPSANPSLAAPPDNVLAAYCTGTACGAKDASTYSGSGVGIWRYNNTSKTAAHLSIDIHGVTQTNSVVIVFSNGTSLPTTAPAVPQAQQIVVDMAPAAPRVPKPQELLERQRDIAHAKLLQLNGKISRLLISGRRRLQSGAVVQALNATPTPQPNPPPADNSTRVWYDNFATPAVPYNTVLKSHCILKTHRNAAFWMDPNASLSDAQLAQFQSDFCDAMDGGYSRVIDLLGDVWGVRTTANRIALISDTPYLQDVNVVFLKLPSNSPSVWGGYFSSVNNVLKKAGGQFATSNEALVFFINADGAASQPEYYLSTLFHELTHMVNFYQRTVAQGASHETWLEETSAMMTEDIVSPAVIGQTNSIIPTDRLAPYVGSGGGISLVIWPPLDSDHYNMGGSLGAFLNRRYGIQLYRQLISCGSDITSSYLCLDGLIRRDGGLGFSDELARFAVSVFSTLPAKNIPSAFGFPEVQDSGYTLSAIDVSAFQPGRLEFARDLAGRFPATSHTYFVENAAAGGQGFSMTGVVVPPLSTLMIVVR